MKLVAIQLLATSMIAGVPRSPVEGIQTVPEADANRLIEANQAVLADLGEDAGDGLDDLGVTKLRVIAKDEGVTVPPFTKETEKEITIAAIRAKRDAPDDRLDAMDEPTARATAKAEDVAVADDADLPTIVAAIRAHRSAKG